MESNIIIKYYFKKNHEIQKCCVKYLEFLKVIDYYNKVDNKGNNYNCGYTYQLLYFQNYLLNTKELNIGKCNFYLNDEIIPI